MSFSCYLLYSGFGEIGRKEKEIKTLERALGELTHCCVSVSCRDTLTVNTEPQLMATEHLFLMYCTVPSAPKAPSAASRAAISPFPR